MRLVRCVFFFPAGIERVWLVGRLAGWLVGHAIFGERERERRREREKKKSMKKFNLLHHFFFRCVGILLVL